MNGSCIDSMHHCFQGKCVRTSSTKTTTTTTTTTTSPITTTVPQEWWQKDYGRMSLYIDRGAFPGRHDEFSKGDIYLKVNYAERYLGRTGRTIDEDYPWFEKSFTIKLTADPIIYISVYDEDLFNKDEYRATFTFNIQDYLQRYNRSRLIKIYTLGAHQKEYWLEVSMQWQNYLIGSG